MRTGFWSEGFDSVWWPLSASCSICSAVRSNGPNDRKELAANVAAISAKVRTKKATLVDSGFLSERQRFGKAQFSRTVAGLRDDKSVTIAFTHTDDG